MANRFRVLNIDYRNTIEEIYAFYLIDSLRTDYKGVIDDLTHGIHDCLGDNGNGVYRNKIVQALDF